jgi:hypothetical protein
MTTQADMKIGLLIITMHIIGQTRHAGGMDKSKAAGA